MKPIAYIHNDFKEKFGIPRQSGMLSEFKSQILFLKEYSVNEAVRGLEEFSHIWIIWEFSEAKRDVWSPTVRPPKLGGNKRMGVFATRSPFRPNPIGISCVQLDSIEYTKNGPILNIRGADLMDNTPIYDIKPYLPFSDSYPDAKAGFTEEIKDVKLEVNIRSDEFNYLSYELKKNIIDILSSDPRPSYHNDDREYGIKYNEYNIRFNVINNILNIISIEKLTEDGKNEKNK